MIGRILAFLLRRPGKPRRCGMSGQVLPAEFHSRIIWGGTKENRWPNYVSRGCPVCRNMPVSLDRDLRMSEHTIPARGVRRFQHNNKMTLGGDRADSKGLR